MAKYPGVYTRVSSYLKWIQTSMVENIDNLDKESYLVMKYFPAAGIPNFFALISQIFLLLKIKHFIIMYFSEKDDNEEAEPEAEGEHHAKPLNFFQNLFWPLYYPYRSWTEMKNSASGIFKINQPIYDPNFRHDRPNYYF